jgi:MFS family permease
MLTFLIQAGAVCGVLTSSYVIDKWGRRAGILFCSTFSIIGSVMCCAAQNPGMFIAFRFVQGFGANAFVPVAGVYSSELAPPALRGFFGGLNGVMIVVGYSLAAYMGLAFFHASDPTVQWRTPLGLAIIPPTITLLLLPILPESPRWLLMQDRFEDAEKIVHRLHKGRKEFDSGRNEFALMRIQAEQDKTMDSSWKVLFTRRAYRKRAVISILIGVFGQASGVTVINNFSPLIYSTLGFDPEETLILLCGWISGGIFASLIGKSL